MREVLKNIIRYWRDSRDISKGAKEVFEYLTDNDVDEYFRLLGEYSSIERAASVICEKVVNREAEKFARAMCGSDETCFNHMYNEWHDKQGVRVERQCINTFVKFTGFIALDTYDCVKKCGGKENKECVKKCLTQRLR